MISLPRSACPEACAWCRPFRSERAAWLACSRGDWMLWIAYHRIGFTNKPPAGRALLLARADCAALSLPLYERVYPDDNRPRHCIRTLRAFARGKATQEQGP